MTHPLEQFHFCPRCGSPRFEEHDARSKVCRDCGFNYYFNASAATVCVLLNARHELLVCRRGREPQKGMLDLPGGFVDPGEGIEEGMLREIKEETGLTARIERFLFSFPNTYLFSGFEVITADSFFLCSVEGEARAQAADDAAELFWLPRAGLRPAEFAFSSTRKGVERLLNGYPQLWEQPFNTKHFTGI